MYKHTQLYTYRSAIFSKRNQYSNYLSVMQLRGTAAQRSGNHWGQVAASELTSFPWSSPMEFTWSSHGVPMDFPMGFPTEMRLPSWSLLQYAQFEEVLQLASSWTLSGFSCSCDMLWPRPASATEVTVRDDFPLQSAYQLFKSMDSRWPWQPCRMSCGYF